MDLNDKKYYINRELSWLEFNSRVLEEAWDESNLLLERLRFLSITASNLDEFFMVRIPNLTLKRTVGAVEEDPSGLSADEQLGEISKKVHEIVKGQYDCLNNTLLAALEKEGILISPYEKLTTAQKDYVSRYFRTTLFPILTPMAVDQSRPFPLLNNRAPVILVELAEGEEARLAVVQVPTVIPRLIRLPGEGGKAVFITLEEIIRCFIAELFRGSEIIQCALFRITRNSDLEIDEEDTPDLLSEIEQSVKRRKWGRPVRLEIEESMDKAFLEFLKVHLEVEQEEIYIIDGLMDITALAPVISAKGFDHLRNKELKPAPVMAFKGKDVFAAIAKGDILVHHPYESFESVINFVNSAANDPGVLAIKQTLYRVSGDSPVVKALMQAAENGKQVTVLVELKARFDEENNIGWARRLERSGCHVIYGLVGLKTHCKACLVVRKEEEGIKRYVHLSTGNYNDTTAKLYTDIGFFTCKESFGRDISALFNSLTGYSKAEAWNKISAAPTDMREMFIGEIRNETKNAQMGLKAKIWAKMNSLVDTEIIKALYEASMAGVEIKLLIRGICALRPQMAGVSENIQVYSIVGRFLEHSRIYYFENNGKARIYLSSADWMSRNLNRRVELAFPVEDERLKGELRLILETCFADRAKRRTAQANGSYTRDCAQSGGMALFESQSALYHMYNERYKASQENERRAMERNQGQAVFTPVLKPEEGK